MVKGINLVPDDIRQGWKIKRLKTGFIVFSVLYIAIIAAFWGRQAFVLYEKKADLEGLEAERAALAAKNSDYLTLSNKLSEIRRHEGEIRKRFEASEGLSGKKIAWSLVMRKLSHELPPKVWLKTLSTSDAGAEKKVRFLGGAASNRAVSEFVFKLENSGYFKDASLSYIQRREAGESMVYDFEVYALLKPSDEIIHE